METYAVGGVTRQLRKASQGSGMIAAMSEGQRTNLGPEAETWLAENSRVIREAVRHYVAIGTWPETDELQRMLDQDGLDVDLQEVYRSMPRALRGPTAYPSERVALRIRAIRQVPEARALLVVAAAAIRAAVGVYMTKSDEEQVITQQNPLIVAASDGNPVLARRAVDLLMSDDMSPLAGGGSSGSTDFRYNVSRNIRSYRNVETIDDFLSVQRELLDKHRPPARPPVLAPGAYSGSSRLDEVLNQRLSPWSVPSFATAPTQNGDGDEPGVGPAASLTYQLHPALAGEPFELAMSGNPRHAVQEAWHELRTLLYDGWPELEPKDGTDLANSAFSEKSGCVRVGTPDLDDETRKNLQEGVHRLGLAIPTMMRNPAAHGRKGWAPASLDERQYAYGALAIISTLAWWVQAALDARSGFKESTPRDRDEADADSMMPEKETG